MNIRLHFQSKEKRDAKYKELKSQGHNLTKSRSTGSILHPEYIADYQGIEKEDNKFGNTLYKTEWGVLYSLETTPKFIIEAREERKSLKKLLKD
jgi:hypothetical protein